MKHTCVPQIFGLVLLTAVASGCETNAVSVTEIMNHGRCMSISPGVTTIAYEKLPKVRGTRLLTEPGSEAANLQGSEFARLVVVSKGKQPSAGYALTMQRATQTGPTVRLYFDWKEPAPGTVQAQVVTHPCSVVEVQATSNETFDTLHVEAWNNDNKIGEVRFKQPDTAALVD